MIFLELNGSIDVNKESEKKKREKENINQTANTAQAKSNSAVKHFSFPE
jgi:hypothetical protein